MLSKFFCWLFLTFCFSLASAQPIDSPIVVGSKRFTENYVVAEIFAQLIEDRGYRVVRKFGMGGTMVAYNALKTGEIHIYPEYTGTIAEAIVKNGEADFDRLNEKLSLSEIEMLTPLGFDNSYVTVMTKEKADSLGILSMSDLSGHPDLVGAFSFEFQKRNDGWPALKKVYNLKNKVRGMDVPLTYEALRSGKVEFAEAYSTEPLIKKFNFIILEDDKKFFPKYEAIALVGSNFPNKLKQSLNELAGKMTNNKIIELNTLATEGVPIPQVANTFLIDSQLIQTDLKRKFTGGIEWNKMWTRTKTHLFLTLLAVFLSTLIAIPLAVAVAPYKKLSQIVMGGAGLMQTIPSIALLTFMIPFFGIGFLPAIVGLFIYSLLPILQNTYVAMIGIDPRLVTAARGIGLYPSEVLFSVKLPLAFPTILAGIRTATILSIGTATLAAFIGAGGLGEPIMSGLALNDTSQVLQGAIPAAALALILDGLFSLISRSFTKQI